jgi:thiol-disulfide isomerase/thioredoxin
MIQVKVLGPTPPCAKCKQAEARARKVAARFPGQVEVVKVDALSDEALSYGLLSTPATVIEDRVVANGKLLAEDELEQAIKETLGG